MERLKLTKDSKLYTYNYFPTDFWELRELLEKLLDKKGLNANLNDIDVSKVDIFYDDEEDLGLFEGLDPHNIDISKWDVSNVEDMSGTFYECNNFNCDLSNWNVSKVKIMNAMFKECENFKGKGLEKWNVSNVVEMFNIFNGCYNFNCNLSNWGVSNVKDMEAMFYCCENFDCNLSGWDVSNVKSMQYMFKGCTNFMGKGLEKWKPIKCETMYEMFDNCDSLKNKPSWYKK